MSHRSPRFLSPQRATTLSAEDESTMGKDYHRATAESIPLTHENRLESRPRPPQSHYSADSGDWDGQLPHAEVAALAENQPQADHPNWPGILDRMKWTRAMIRAYKLAPPQAALLNEIAYRDGRGIGCTATMETLALDTGYNEKSIRRAIQALEQRGIVIAHGSQGQKKIMGLPVKNGQLPWPTSVTESEVATHAELQLRSESPKLEQQTRFEPRSESPKLTPTSVRESEVPAAHQDSTSVRESEVDPNFGQRVRATSVRESDITRSKQERERENYINLSLSGSNPGSSVRESEVTNQKKEQEQDRIRDLVVQNWPLLEQSGWDFLDPAIRHYQTHGITYLERDLRVKSDNLRKAELATRTCVHCGTVHKTTDKVRACIRCEDSICVDERSSCRQHTCFRKQGGGSPDRGRGPADQLRR